MERLLNITPDQLMILNFNGTGAARRPQEVTNLTNFFYYVILLPFGIVGNALSLVVSIYLLRGTERRFSADIYCAFLAVTGLLCIACVHVVTVFLLLSNDVSNVPAELCRFQTVATTVYLNVEFVLQIAMSIDRYSALTRPMKYKTNSKNLPCLLLAFVVFVSIVYALISSALPSGSSEVMATWKFCARRWNVDRGEDGLEAFVVFVWFTVGLALFVRSNSALVIVLCRYNQQRSSAVLEEIARVKQAIEKRQTDVANRKRQQLAPGGVVKSKSAGGGGGAEFDGRAQWKTGSESSLPTLSKQPQRSPGLPSSPRIIITEPSDVERSSYSQQGDSDTVEQAYLAGAAVQAFTFSDAEDSLIIASSRRVKLNHQPLSTSDPCLERESNESFVVTSSKRSPGRRQTYPVTSSHSNASNSSNSSSRVRPRSVLVIQESSQSQAKSTLVGGTMEDNNENESSIGLTGAGLDYENVTDNSQNGKPNDDYNMNNNPTRTQARVHINDNHHHGHRDGEKRVALLHMISQISYASDSNNGGLLVTRPQYDRSVSNTSARSAKRFHENVKRLLHRLEVKAKRQKKEILLARLIVICSCVFVATLFPYAVVSVFDVLGLRVSPTAREMATRCVFLNVVLNPIFHGLCRKKYRAGYDYLAQFCCHSISCGFFDKPQDDKLFYDCRKKKRLQQKVERRINKVVAKKARPLSTTSARFNQFPAELLNRDAEQGDDTGSRAFQPSPKLHDLFNRYEAAAAREANRPASASSSNASSIDYDALVFGDQQLYDNLRHVCSLIQQMPASDSCSPEDGEENDGEEGNEENETMGGEYEALFSAVADDRLTVPQIGMVLSSSFDAHERRRRLSAANAQLHQLSPTDSHPPTSPMSPVSLSFSDSGFQRLHSQS